jgi:hypothetical protein
LVIGLFNTIGKIDIYGTAKNIKSIFTTEDTEKNIKDLLLAVLQAQLTIKFFLCVSVVNRF